MVLNSTHLYVVERLLAAGFEHHINALDIALHLALEQLGNGPLHHRPFHLALQVVAQHTAKLLHVVLHSVPFHMIQLSRWYTYTIIHTTKMFAVPPDTCNLTQTHQSDTHQQDTHPETHTNQTFTN